MSSKSRGRGARGKIPEQAQALAKHICDRMVQEQATTSPMAIFTEEIQAAMLTAFDLGKSIERRTAKVKHRHPPPSRN